MPTASLAKPVDSPLKYHGGKSYLAPWIVSQMPNHTHYVEPFFGGGSVLFSKPYDGVSEVINDIDGDLMKFFDVLAKPKLFEKFRRRVATQPFSQPLWERSRDLLAAGGGTAVEQAVAFFILNRQSRAGQMQDFATLSRTRTRRGMNEQTSAWLSAIDGLVDVHERLQRVVILHKPAAEVIRQQDGPETLFYLDPPYPGHTRSAANVYRNEMSLDDHKQLLRVVLRCKGKVMISGYPSPLYAVNLRSWRRVIKQIPNHAASGEKKRKMTEELWMNF